MRKKYYRIFIRKSGNKQASRRILPVPFQFFHHSVRRIKTGIIQRLFASVCPGGTAGQKQSPHLFSLHRMSCCLYRPAYLPVSPTPLSKEIWKQYGRYCESYHPSPKPEDLMFYTYRNGHRNKMSSDNVSRILLKCETKLRKDNPGLIHLHSHLFRNPNFNKIQTFCWSSA